MWGRSGDNFEKQRHKAIMFILFVFTFSPDECGENIKPADRINLILRERDMIYRDVRETTTNGIHY
jgi:hypothetical protein